MLAQCMYCSYCIQALHMWSCYFQTGGRKWRPCQRCNLWHEDGVKKMCGLTWNEKALYLCPRCWMDDCTKFCQPCICPRCCQIRRQSSEASTVVDLPNPSNEDLQKRMLALETKIEDMWTRLEQRFLVLEKTIEKMSRENASRHHEVQTNLEWLKSNQEHYAEEHTTSYEGYDEGYSYQYTRWSSGYDEGGAQDWYSDQSWNSDQSCKSWR